MCRWEIFIFTISLFSLRYSDNGDSATIQLSRNWLGSDALCRHRPCISDRFLFSPHSAPLSLQSASLSLIQPAQTQQLISVTVEASSAAPALSCFLSSPQASGTNLPFWTSSIVAQIKPLIRIFLLIILFTETLSSFQSALSHSVKNGDGLGCVKGWNEGARSVLILTDWSLGRKSLLQRPPEEGRWLFSGLFFHFPIYRKCSQCPWLCEGKTE